jgi:hypothetical protein
MRDRTRGSPAAEASNLLEAEWSNQTFALGGDVRWWNGVRAG